MTNPTIERRVIPVQELRVLDSATPRIEGYAALFNTRSEDLGGFVEEIAPGAFADAIKHSDIRALWNHNPLYVLGRVSAGTLSVNEDMRGLHIVNEPPNTTWARDMLESVKRRDVTQMSFGFTVARGGATWREDGNTLIRTITRVGEVVDVSPVTYPAYTDTSVAMRSLTEWRDAQTPDWRAQIAEIRRRHEEALKR